MGFIGRKHDLYNNNELGSKRTDNKFVNGQSFFYLQTLFKSITHQIGQIHVGFIFILNNGEK